LSESPEKNDVFEFTQFFDGRTKKEDHIEYGDDLNLGAYIEELGQYNTIKTS